MTASLGCAVALVVVLASSAPAFAEAATTQPTAAAAPAQPPQPPEGVRFPGQNGTWSDWWMPPDYSTHGHAIDTLFLWIFWITVITLIAVWAVMGVFLVKYRQRPDKKKAIYTQGNTRLEMCWTLAPAVVLLLLALMTKRVWDDYRYSPTMNSPDKVQVLVVGQQFSWNVVYPGPDGKLGRYLAYPKTTDLHWPKLPAGMSHVFHPTAPGPAYLPEKDAAVILSQWADSQNPLGKDFSDPDGFDDLWQNSVRPLEIPKGRPIEVVLSSRDVLHDFFLPNYRVKLDAVPGMKGHVYFTATTSSAELEKPTRRRYTVAELLPHTRRDGSDYVLVANIGDPGVEDFQGAPAYMSYKVEMLDGTELTADRLKAMTRTRVIAYAKVKPNSKKKYTLDELAPLVGDATREFRVVIAADDPRGFKDPRGFVGYRGGEQVIAADGGKITAETVKDLKAAGLSEVTAVELDAASRESKRVMQVSLPEGAEVRLVMPDDDRNAMTRGKVRAVWQATPLAGNGAILSRERLAELKANDINEVTAYRQVYWDLICQELCGAGHGKMQGRVVVLEPQVFKAKYETPAGSTPPSSGSPIVSRE